MLCDGRPELRSGDRLQEALYDFVYRIAGEVVKSEMSHIRDRIMRDLLEHAKSIILREMCFGPKKKYSIKEFMDLFLEESEKGYTYEEFMKKFLPKAWENRLDDIEDPAEFGKELARRSCEKAFNGGVDNE